LTPHDPQSTDYDRVLYRAHEIYTERNTTYRDMWRTYGSRGALFQMRCAAERAFRKLWSPKILPATSQHVDDLLDTINYAVFAIINLEDGNRDGTWEYPE
jgi:ribosomal protein L20